MRGAALDRLPARLDASLPEEAALRDGDQRPTGAVVVLHDLSLAARYCDRLYLLSHGKLDCAGPVAEVLTNENIARVYGVDSQIECTSRGVSVTPLRRIGDHHP